MGILVNCLFPLTVVVGFALGQRELDFSVYGDSVFQTDTRTYNIYSEQSFSQGMKSVVVICKVSFVSASSTLLLYQNNRLGLLHESLANGLSFDTSATKIFRYNRSNISSLAGTYVCSLNFTIRGSNDSVFTYAVESKMDIEISQTSSICASSIGYSGYWGEYGILSCGRNYFVSYEYLSQGQWHESSLNYRYLYGKYGVTIRSSYNGFKMRCRSNNTAKTDDGCQSPDFKIYKFLGVRLSQSNDASDSLSVAFTCKSTPPRLMYWEVLGKYGNILDLYQFNQSFYVDGNIIIEQSAGVTSVRISGSIVTQKGIHTVVCSTYGTSARAAAYANLRPIFQDATQCDDSVSTISSYSQTSEQNLETPTEDANTLTGTRLRSTGRKDTPVPQITPIMCKEDGNFEQFTVSCHFIKGALVLLLIIIMILIVVIVYMIYRLKHLSNKKRDSKPTSIPPETELHENPVYVPYSQTMDLPHCDADKEKELTYANV